MANQFNSESEGKLILGFSDDVNECDCCGKRDLKGTYSVLLNGCLNYFGSVCAFKVHAISYEEQAEVKKEHKKRIKAIDKLKEMENEGRTDAYWISKMYKFVLSKNINELEFINKYGKIIEDCIYYTAYQIGNHTKLINK